MDKVILVENIVLLAMVVGFLALWWLDLRRDPPKPAQHDPWTIPRDTDPRARKRR
ncbi:MAG: hypothetical protein AAF636_10315 [Pseudomonadota bacterium]